MTVEPIRLARRRFLELTALTGGAVLASGLPGCSPKDTSANAAAGQKGIGGGFSPARLTRMHEVMAGYVERGEVPGIVTLVSRRDETHVDVIGKLAFSGTEPMRRDTLFRIASLTKPITAAATMILVEDGKLRLDDAVDRWLPELADRKVLKRLDGPLSETVPAIRPITVRDVLTFRLGYGFGFELPQDSPMQRVLNERKLAAGPNLPDVASPDEWIGRFATLPLLYQPGERWLYNTAADILGVLIGRASGQSFETFLAERIFEPLGMKDTGFSVPADKLSRLATCYYPNPETKKLDVFDDARNSRFSRAPGFASGAGGLVSTIDDFFAFGRMMLKNGRNGRERILSRPSVEAMTTNQLTPAQKVGSILPDDFGWGFGMAVVTARDDVGAVPGQYGWNGGYGTSWRSDPREDMVSILLTQVVWTDPSGPPVYRDFWTEAYQAIDD